MQKVATYYVTLQPIKEGRPFAEGLKNIAYVNDPAVEEVGVYLNAHDPRVVADESIQKDILEYLRSCGIEKPDNWKEVNESDYLEAVKLNLSNPEDQESFNDVSKKDGTGQWLVRYEYDGPQDDKNRGFCSEVLSLNRIYTEEEIKNGLSNPEFGNYSIWDYKGSYGCRHTWKRKIYFEDYEDGEVRKVGNVPQVVAKLDDREATTLNAYLSRDEKMQVCAPLLIPDKDIPRNDEIGRYNMRFSKETILELQAVAEEKELFKKSDLFKDTHRGDTAPSYVLDQWVAMSETDKAYTEYGFDVKRCPVGTLFVLSQVTDKGYWEREIKANKKHAYSIEALMNLTIIKMSAAKQEYGDVVVFTESGDFLLLQRADDDDYMPNKLCFAGGKIESGEDAKTGALRELEEETGIKEPNATFIETITNNDDTKSHYFHVTTSQTFTPSDEHKAYSWVKSIDNIPAEMFIEGDKERLVQIINKVKMEKEQIVLPDGEHLINGTIYIVEGGVVTSTKEVTSEQEEVIEEKVEEEMSEAPKEEEKPKEEMAEAPKEEEKPKEEMAEEAPVVVEETKPEGSDDRLAKLEKAQEEIIEEMAKIKAEATSPEEVKVEMSDNRPQWKKVSDGLNGINQ